MSESNTCLKCGKPASMKCPTCSKLGLPISLFCSQQCFSVAWPSHKLIHSGTQEEEFVKHRPEFRGYQFFGPLRPGLVSPIRTVPDHILKPDYASSPDGEPKITRAMRASHTIDQKTPEEIKIMKEVCRIAADILAEAGKIAKPGVTTDEIDKLVHELCIEKNAYPSTLKYRKFPKSCCTSVNEIICHGIPDSRKLEDGDIMNLDICVYYQGFHADLNETWLIGDNVDPKHKKLVETAYQCLEEAIKMCKPGVLYRNLGKVISKVANAEGFSVVRSFCGHGVGKLLHTVPNIPHYANNKAVGVMKPGHTFTIEPMINEGTWHDVSWPDDWTISTRDGKRSAQFEHTILITETGCEVLTKRAFGSYIDRFGDESTTKTA